MTTNNEVSNNKISRSNVKIIKFYVNAEFKLNQSYRRIEDATDKDRSNVTKKEMDSVSQIIDQTTDFFRKSGDLLRKINDAAKMYNFKVLEHDINEVWNTNLKADGELYRLNSTFLEYLKRSI